MSVYSDDQLESAAALLEACRTRGLRVATAESCTGGLIAGLLTAIAGSSDVVERGFVTYSNQAKTEMLGVAEAALVEHGAVSEEAAKAMAEGALDNSKADLSVAVTGIAGPGGGTGAKPVGLVHIAAARRGGGTLYESHVFEGDREAVRMRTVEAAVALLRCRTG